MSIKDNQTKEEINKTLFYYFILYNFKNVSSKIDNILKQQQKQIQEKTKKIVHILLIFTPNIKSI
jgi:hypothetical protein